MPRLRPPPPTPISSSVMHEDAAMSSFFEWESRYNLNIPHMDADHQRIVEGVNLLHELHDAKAAHATIDRAFLDLARVTARHFADEEALMEKMSFPDRRKHGLIHKALLDRLLQYQKEFERDKVFTEDFFVFLRMWLRSHICGIDVKYAVHTQAA
jgi:hemerythrin-like metal-binding protein